MMFILLLLIKILPLAVPPFLVHDLTIQWVPLCCFGKLWFLCRTNS
ncbi:hypothetical protein SLEP1_g29538 [Rubroshorea leprosula]|uniref:Uncharacterized protein n=1 Tax=Rubroshorea leprosula TaxID=152421 RepID=A0AAV5K2Y2_9ROSI|nr:hypothetical protein SLEP1_g29538 [Rubroshorea leprosula]